MNHTTYYQLSLWEQDDRIMREDFNDNNAKIDAALGALAAKGYVTGTYEGRAASDDMTTAHEIHLGFHPSLVIITYFPPQAPDSMIPARPANQILSDCTLDPSFSSLTDDGFRVTNKLWAVNTIGITCHYIAFR